MSDAPNPNDSMAGQEAAARKQQIPGYQMLEKIGKGAMAVVFKARQVSLDRVVAIKVLPRRLSKDPDYVERFYAEGRAAARLNHPNIVAAIDVGESQGYHYFVMEYVEGKTVYDELADGKIYDEHEALAIILQIARALEHAHGQEMMHRDVKPKNIMITRDGTAKLMDMGLARVADDAAAIQAETGKLFGTPYYISPEQIVGKKNVDLRCDIYSLGATLYHMVTGKVPFDGETAKEVMVKHCREPLTPPDRHNLDLSFGLVKVIQKMMAKNRHKRYQTIAAVIDDLRSIDFLLEVQGDDNADPGSLGDLVDEMQKPEPPKNQSTSRPTQNEPPPPPPTVMVPSPLNKLLLAGLIVSLLGNIALAVLLWMG
jgi:serine/threonine-protein kinase